MAQSDRFYFWRGYYDAMEYLTDEEVGQLFRAICAYAFDDEEPDFTDNRLMQVAWTMVADSAQESVEVGRRRSEAGQKGGRPPKSTVKSSAKRGAKSSALSTAKSTVKSSVESTAESSVESVGYGNVPQPAVGDGVASAADAATLRQDDGVTIPPKPIGWS